MDEYPFLAGLPFWVVYLSLFGIVFARAQATYWIGRAAAAGLHRSRLGGRIEGGRLGRAERIIGRFGPPAVTLSFMTVGIQTAVNATAGAMRMPFGRYLLALVPGCLIWAGIYSTVGMAALWAWLRLLAGSPAGAAAVAAAAAAAVAAAVWWRIARRRRARAEPEREPVPPAR
ncbi:DedA family protein [Allonocardiopsis opalescens]|uniref:Membrane protein DedA with SNARE-associated domain n=1 Tax=Allonocardiopsis opalescens TaxID=1144618 RepID=A0A2T0QE01_9ACTN|nr:VTT domain-containing protein [Allonocardiopsis opalescens]PRY02122.1 membrane protein DedA with SNARE-associated domain [Allonocardiopsis opalescens]